MSALPPLGHYRTLTPDERARARDELNENIDSVALLGLLEIHLADGEGDEELARDLIDEFDEAGETVLAARARIALWEHPTITDTSLLEGALARFTDADDAAGRAFTLARWGQFLAENDKDGDAYDLLMLALEISTELGDLIGEGRAAQQLATVADDDEEREEFLLRAVDSWRTAGYAFGATHALLDLARLEIGDGRYRDATVSAELALELAPANLRGDCLVHIGVARAEEDPADIRARASFEEALKGPLEMVDRETVQGFLDRLPVLTDEQRERLARIVNVDQRRALVSALTHGEDIPDYAWTPVPPKTPEFDAMIEGLATEIRDRFGEEGLEAALDPNLLEDDE